VKKAKGPTQAAVSRAAQRIKVKPRKLKDKFVKNEFSPSREYDAQPESEEAFTAKRNLRRTFSQLKVVQKDTPTKPPQR
jgi:hypothetical protein